MLLHELKSNHALHTISEIARRNCQSNVDLRVIAKEEWSRDSQPGEFMARGGAASAIINLDRLSIV